MSEVQSLSDKAQMTIKAVPRETRALMTACAARAGLPLGMWLATAVATQARVDAGNGPVEPDPPPPPVDLEVLQRVMEAAVAVSQASGKLMPKTTANHAYALLTQRLRVERGMPARAVRRPTLRQIGHTALIEAAE